MACPQKWRLEMQPEGSRSEMTTIHGWEGEATRLAAELAAEKKARLESDARAASAEKRATIAEVAAAQEKTRREEADLRADDHPNTSWGGLYADRDGWRRAFLEAATLASIDGVSLLEWRDRAIQLQHRLDAIHGLAGKPLVQEPAFVPHKLAMHRLAMPIRGIHQCMASQIPRLLDGSTVSQTCESAFQRDIAT